MDRTSRSRPCHRWPEAETVHKRAFALNETTLGPQHTEVASKLNNPGLFDLKMDRRPDRARTFTAVHLC
jgi:hypothetical protein